MQLVSSGDNLREMSYSILVGKIREFVTNLLSAEILHSLHSIKVTFSSISEREKERENFSIIT